MNTKDVTKEQWQLFKEIAEAMHVEFQQAANDHYPGYGQQSLQATADAAEDLAHTAAVKIALYDQTHRRLQKEGH